MYCIVSQTAVEFTAQSLVNTCHRLDVAATGSHGFAQHGMRSPLNRQSDFKFQKKVTKFRIRKAFFNAFNSIRNRILSRRSVVKVSRGQKCQ